MRVRIAIVLALFLGGAAACSRTRESAPAGEAPAALSGAFDPAAGTAGIRGRIRFEGPVPSSAQIQMNADPVCVALHKEPVVSEDLIVVDGNLVNVFVYVKEGLEKHTFAPPLEPAELRQEGCRFVPHVMGVMVNQGLRIVNADPTVHNVRCVAEKNPQFNVGQPMKGFEHLKKFANPEVMMKFRCDVHRWMTAYLGVLAHPYFAVTGKEGEFSLKNLPPGQYQIEAWHEKLGSQVQSVVVTDGEMKEIGFSFKSS